MITDGTLIYVVSLVPPNQEEKEQAKLLGEDARNKIQVSVLDPSQNYKVQKKIILFKNEHKMHFMKKDNKADIFYHTNWATNGEYLAVFWKYKVMFFSLKTGIRIFKETVDSGEADEF